MNTFQRRHKGFTIIELMVVLAIISILAVIALPVYQNYASRAKVTEAINAAGGIQTQLAEFYNNNQYFPTGEEYSGAADATLFQGAYTKKITLGTDCALLIEFDLPGVSGGAPLMAVKPWYDEGLYVWSYYFPNVSRSLTDSHIPSSTRSLVVANASTPPPDFPTATHCCSESHVGSGGACD